MYVALKMWTKWGGRELRGEGGRDGGREGEALRACLVLLWGGQASLLGAPPTSRGPVPVMPPPASMTVRR